MVLAFNIFKLDLLGLIILGTALLGITSAVLGVFTLLKKQALIGDAISHTTLPGVVIFFILTSSKRVNVLIIGAGISAFLAIMLMRVIKKYSKIENDAILALLLSSFFGFGKFLISYVSRINPEYSKVRLDDFVFGQAATILREDIIILAVVLIIVLTIIFITWRHLKIQIFDNEFYRSLGFSSNLIEFLTSFITIIVIVAGIKTVGVILMSSLLIAPAIAARQWSDKLFNNVLISSIFGLIAAVFGSLYSVNTKNMPTGPAIVVIGTLIAIVSILLAPKRGLLFQELRRIIHRKNIIKYHFLIHLYENKILLYETFKSQVLSLDKYVYKKGDYAYLNELGINKARKIIEGSKKI